MQRLTIRYWWKMAWNTKIRSWWKWDETFLQYWFEELWFFIYEFEFFEPDESFQAVLLSHYFCEIFESSRRLRIICHSITSLLIQVDWIWEMPSERLLGSRFKIRILMKRIALYNRIKRKYACFTLVLAWCFAHDLCWGMNGSCHMLLVVLF